VTVESIVARARARYEDVMSEAVQLRRGTGTATWDSSTSTYTPGVGAVVYDGQALVRPPTRDTRSNDAEDGTVVEFGYVVKFPANTVVERGDTVTVTASTYDAAMVGRTVWVHHAPVDGWQSARVAFCTEQRPEV
jgi:hypothetical protein